MSMENIPFSEGTTETVEMTEIDGMGQGAVLQFMDIPKGSHAHEEKEFQTCLGDLYVIVNALRDYANLLESAVSAWGLTGFHAAAYQLHAERCRKRRAKGSRDPDTGMDGLEALMYKRRNEQMQKEKKKTKESENDPFMKRAYDGK